MLQNNAFSPLRKPELSCLRALSFIFILALTLFVSTTSVYSAQVTLAWNPNTEPDFAGYKLYTGLTSGNYDNTTDVGNQTGYTLQNLVADQMYYIVVTAYDTSNNESGYSAEVVYTVPAPDLTAPSTPASLQATATSTSQINLSWNASSDNIGVTGYRIYRGGTQITTTSNTTYQDTGLSSSTTYSYTVSAYDAAGNESVQSSAFSATTLSSSNSPPVLSVIANITVNEGAAITLNPTATDPNGDVLSFTYSGWMTSSSYTTNYNDSGTHTVTVTVSDGALTDFQVVTIIVKDVDTTGGGQTDTIPPTTPASLTAKGTSSSQIILSWNASTDNVGVIGYRVYRDGTQIATTTNTSYQDTGLSLSTTYTTPFLLMMQQETNLGSHRHHLHILCL